jgi:hypothetical protein
MSMKVRYTRVQLPVADPQNNKLYMHDLSQASVRGNFNDGEAAIRCAALRGAVTSIITTWFGEITDVMRNPA